MKTKLILYFLLCVSIPLQAQISIAKALVNNKNNPTGIDPNNLFFSWEMTSKSNDESQTAYELVISSSKENLDNNIYDIYNSKKVVSNQSIQVYPKGIDLSPATIYYWKVRVWNKDNNISQWCRSQYFITGIFNNGDWNEANWIGYENMPEEKRVVPFLHYKMKNEDVRKQDNAISPYLRKTFDISKKIKSAVLFISGLGHYEASLNGEKIGNAFLSPGWTNYDKTILYNTYDITDKINQGQNSIGVILGNGFYHVSQERYSKGTGYFGSPKMIAMIKLVFADQSTSYIISDNSWKTTPSPIIYNNIYGGEDFDATLNQKDWNQPSFKDINWKPAIYTSIPYGNLEPEIDYPVVLIDTLIPKSTSIITKNSIVYDFGQNLSVIPKIKIKGKPGQKIKLIPGELIHENGEINQADGVTPHYYQYTIGSTSEETWQPNFSYFAARYIQIEGISTSKEDSENPKLVEVNLLHNRNSSPKNGNFSCSDNVINNIYSIIDKAIQSNIQSYITDNPQREKLSWQGEQNFMRTSINYNYNMYNMYRSLNRNLKDSQYKNGLIPDIAPEYVQFSGPFVDSPEWGTTSILNTWFLYKFYGDSSAIKKNFEMMSNYANYLIGKSKGNLLLYGLGDWLDIGNVTPNGLTASAYYYKSIKSLAEMAKVINDQKSFQKYNQLAIKIKEAFNAKFFDNKNKMYGTGSQTSLSMPLAIGLVNNSDYTHVLQNLINQVKNHDKYAITAGDVGNKFLVKTLSMNGYSDILYEMVQKGDTPGYKYQLNKGVTALAETWDGKMSQNQLGMGHIIEWFYEGILGINQDSMSTGFKKIIISPQIVGNLSFAKGYFNSPYGTIRSEWKKVKEGYEFIIEIPVNSTAKFKIPIHFGSKVSLNAQLVKDIKTEKENYTFDLGSGLYKIKIQK